MLVWMRACLCEALCSSSSLSGYWGMHLKSITMKLSICRASLKGISELNWSRPLGGKKKQEPQNHLWVVHIWQKIYWMFVCVNWFMCRTTSASHCYLTSWSLELAESYRPIVPTVKMHTHTHTWSFSPDLILVPTGCCFNTLLHT